MFIHLKVGIPPTEWKRSCKNTDWRKFSQSVIKYEEEVPKVKINSKESLIQELDNIYRIVDAAVSENCKWVKVSTKPKTRPWWNSQLLEARSKLREAHERWRGYKNKVNWDTYKDIQRTYNKMLFKAQKKSCQEFVKETDNVSEMSRLNKILRKPRSRQVQMLKKADGTMCTTPQESLAVLTDHVFKQSRPANSINHNDDNEILDFDYPRYQWMAVDKIRDKINEFRPNQSPGPDYITPMMLKFLPDVVLSRLGEVFAATYYSGFTPQTWLESKTIFIEKPGRDPMLPGSYRPIGLTSYLFKLLEKLVYQHLLDTALKENPLHKSQHGFRRGFSTETALQNVVS